jgi:hypothetical protein
MIIELYIYITIGIIIHNCTLELCSQFIVLDKKIFKLFFLVSMSFNKHGENENEMNWDVTIICWKKSCLINSIQ